MECDSLDDFTLFTGDEDFCDGSLSATPETPYTDVFSDLEIEVDYDMEEESAPTSDDEGTDSSERPVIDCIENFVLSFMKQIVRLQKKRVKAMYSEDDEEKKLSRSDFKLELSLVDRKKALSDDGSPSWKVLRFPKRHPSGSLKAFAQLFRVLDLAHEAALSGVPATKRDIYYKDVALFKNQRVVDTLVDDLAATFGLERSDMHIRSSPKGLVCGSGLTIDLISGDQISCTDSEGSLIPAGEDIESFSLNEDVAWILVVEKEAVFQTLCRLNLCCHEWMPGPGLMITGKGYPDLATRHLVKSLADALPRSIPILALVDGDPFGLDILSVYKYGSQGMQHEQDKLATRRIKWLGLWASELTSLGVSKDQLLTITKHDEKKVKSRIDASLTMREALAMLRRQLVPLPGKWKKELQYMLHSRRKAEIEILSTAEVDRKDSWQGSQSQSSPDSLVNGFGASGGGFGVGVGDANVNWRLRSELNGSSDVGGGGSFARSQNRALAQHALLMRYLSSKIHESVDAARQRAVQSQK